MIYLLSNALSDQYHFFNLLSYITFRIAIGAMTSLLLTLILGWKMIPMLYNMKFREKINEDVPDRHLQKAGTPTMGGIIVVISVITSTLLWADITNMYVLLVLGATLWMALIGFYDDYTKMRHPQAKGLMARHKFLGQSILGLLIGLALYFWSPEIALRTSTEVPFFKNIIISLGPLYIPFVTLVVSGSSNAINLTDGLDGLAI